MTNNTCRRQRGVVLLLAGLLSLASAKGGEYFLFTSFRNNGEDGLHLVLSTNGYAWTALKGDEKFGPSRLFYDPGFNVIDATMLQTGGQVLPDLQRRAETAIEKKPAVCRRR